MNDDPAVDLVRILGILLATAVISVSLTLRFTHDRFWGEGYDDQMKYIVEKCESQGFFYNRRADDPYFKYFCKRAVPRND